MSGWGDSDELQDILANIRSEGDELGASVGDIEHDVTDLRRQISMIWDVLRKHGMIEEVKLDGDES
jgi:hypothetical protein